MQILDEPRRPRPARNRQLWRWLLLAYAYLLLYWWLVAWILPDEWMLRYSYRDWPLPVFALVFLVPVWVVGLLWKQAVKITIWQALPALLRALLIWMVLLALAHFALDYPRLLFVKLYQFIQDAFWTFVLGFGLSYWVLPSLLWLLPQLSRRVES